MTERPTARREGWAAHGSGFVLRAPGVVAGIVGGFLVVALVLRVQPSQRFSHLVAGGLAFDGGRKGGDLVALPLAVVVGVLVALAVTASVGAQPTVRRRRGVAAQLLWWACPGGIALGALFVGVELSAALAAVTVGAVLLMSAETFLARRAGTVPTPRALTASAMGCLLWALVPVAAVVALSRTTLGIASSLEGVPWVAVAWAVAVAAGGYELWRVWRAGTGSVAGSVTESVTGSVTGSVPEPGARWFVTLPQCALPLLVLALVPARLRLPDASVTTYDTRVLLPLLCWAVAVIGVVACVLRARRLRRPGSARPPVRLVSPFAVLPVVITAMFGVTRAPVVPQDDYHYGETLLGWFRYRAGEVPYVDHQPAHGLVQDDLAAALASAFFDGSAAAHTEALRITCALLAALVFVAVLWTTRSQLLAGLVTVLGVGPTDLDASAASGLTWAVLVAVAWLLVGPRLRATPQWWLVVWVVMTPVLVLAAPAQGLVLAVAAGALAVRSVWDLVCERRGRALVPAAVAAGVLAVVAVLTPLGAMLVAAIRYVLSNAEVNTAAYGVPWSPTLAGSGSTPFVLEVLRMLWVVGLVVCSLVALAELRARRWRSEILARAVFLALFLGGVLPYLMGRVDTAHPSRAGLGTAFVFAVVLPALVWTRLRPPARALLGLGLLTSTAALFGLIVQVDRVTTATSPFVASADLVDGATVGLPGWGRGVAEEPLHLDQAVRLAAVLDEALAPGEPYYDATSRNAQYYYVGRRPPVAVTAVYNSPLPADQRRTIRQLRRSRPEVAVLRQPLGNLDHDGGGLALRTPLLARYLEGAYTPYQQDGFVLGHLGRGLPPGADRSVTLALDDTSDAVWDRGVARAAPAVRLQDPGAALMVREGARVTLTDGTSARVTSVAPGGVVELDRSLADSLVTAVDRAISVPTRGLDRGLYRAWLFEQAFGRVDLQRLPSSWGASLDELQGVSEVSELDASGYLDAVSTTLQVPLSSQDVPDGREPGLVAFDVQCEQDGPGVGSPVVGLSWQSPLGVGDVPGRTFEAVSGRHLLPLDSSAFWRARPGTDALTFTLLDTAGCLRVALTDVSLWERVE